MKITTLFFTLVSLMTTPHLQAATTLDIEDIAIPSDTDDKAYHRAYEAFKAGDFDKAESSAVEAVEAGTSAGYFILGWLHEKGLGRPVNLDTALDYYRKGHAKGFEMTSLRCGILLINSTGTDQKAHRTEGQKILASLNGKSSNLAQVILGKGHAMGLFETPPDFGTALAHLNRAIKDGNVEALIFKAGLLEGQHGYPKVDLTAAITTYELAAAKDSNEAIIAAGTRRLSGPDAIRDEKKGLQWLQGLADKDDAIANYYLGNYYANEKNDFTKALTYLTKSAEKDAPQAHFLLGILNQRGLGAPASEEKAITHFEKAAKLGHLQAAHNLARIHLAQEDSKTRQLNVQKGYQYLAFAASELPDAQAELGMLYLSGQLGTKDLTAGAAWFDKAARNGHATAQNNLAALYELGNGVPQNLENAFKLYSLAAAQGHLTAMTARGRFTALGLGTEKNPPLAWAYLTLAAEKKDEGAMQLLAQLNPQLTKEQLAAAQKELQTLKAPQKDPK